MQGAEKPRAPLVDTVDDPELRVRAGVRRVEKLDKPLKVLLAHAHEEPVLPTAHDDAVPADLEQVVMRCLAKSPQDRLATAAAPGAAPDQCESAGQWTRDDAADWWRRREERQPRTDSARLPAR